MPFPESPPTHVAIGILGPAADAAAKDCSTPIVVVRQDIWDFIEEHR